MSKIEFIQKPCAQKNDQWVEKKLVEENGMKIGVIATQSSSMAGPIIVGKPGDVQYIDLSSYTNEQLKKLKWVRVNPQDVYVSTQRWYIDN